VSFRGENMKRGREKMGKCREKGMGRKRKKGGR
jgi:hypothetical protein